VEVIDLDGGKRVRQVGASKPQGLAFIAETGELVVASGGDGKCRFLDESLNVVATIDGLPDADNVRFDPQSKRVYVAYGEGALAVIDPSSMRKSATSSSKTPRIISTGAGGSRIFVNVPNAQQVAVLDRAKLSVIDKWPLTEAEQNYPMALDEANHRLFIGCRKPAKLLVLDTQGGKTVFESRLLRRRDDIFYDAAARRVYLVEAKGVSACSLSPVRMIIASCHPHPRLRAPERHSSCPKVAPFTSLFPQGGSAGSGLGLQTRRALRRAPRFFLTRFLRRIRSGGPGRAAGHDVRAAAHELSSSS